MPFKMILASPLFLLMVLGLAACAHRPPPEEAVLVPPPQPVMVRASGYAALPVALEQSTLQQRLLAMRASRLDAYRNLAEQIYGTAVFGQSRVDDLTLKGDRFRTLVDTTVRGAQVVDVRELKDGGYETVLEVALNADFQRCLSLVNQFRFDEECRLPMPMGEDFSEAAVPAVVVRPYALAADRPLGE